MTATSKKPGSYGVSFLPEDYLQKKAEGRSGLVMLVLFCIVMFGVAGAFFVTYRQKVSVKRQQEEINARYAQEAKKIEQLNVLVEQKSEMVARAEITTALIEKVPRSILLAEFINRMPEDLTLTGIEIKSKKVVDAAAAPVKGKPAPRSIAGKTPAATASKDAGKKKDDKPEKPKAPKVEYTMIIDGLSRTDQEVADYTASLQQCALLEKVEFKYSSDTVIDDVGLRKFRVECMIKPTADARAIEPLHVPRLAGKVIDSAVRTLDSPSDNVLRKNGLKQGVKPSSSKSKMAGASDKKE